MKRLLAIFCALLVLAAAVACDNAPASGKMAWPAELFAYIAHVSASDDELVVMRGETTIARKRGRFGSRDGVTAALIWTFDGHYVVTRSFRRDGSGIDSPIELVAVDVQNGAIRSIPCVRCTSVAPIEGSKVIVTVGNALESTPEIRQIDLNTPDAPAPYSTDLPQFGVSAKILASVPGYALVSGSNILAVDSAEQLFLLRGDGSVTPLGNTGKNAAASSAAATARNADGRPMFAVHTQEQVSAEGRASGLFLIDAISGERTNTDVTDLIGPAKADLRYEEDVIYYAHDLSWGKDGHLYATWEVITDDGKWGAAPNTAAPTRLWRLDGARWVQVAPEPVVEVRQLSEAARLAVYPDANDTPGGTLYLEQAAQQTHVADNVDAIEIPN